MLKADSALYGNINIENDFETADEYQNFDALTEPSDSDRDDSADGECESEDEDFEGCESPAPLTAQERKLIEAEIADLKTYLSHALAIRENSKGKALLIALKEGFKMAKSFGAAEKAVVFTESRRTQQYLCELLSANGYKDKIMKIN